VTARRGGGRGRRGAGRVDAREALEAAATHASAAIAEGLLAGRCVLDAASLAATGVPAPAHATLRRVADWLDRAARLALAGAGGERSRWLEDVADALAAEIARWEARSRGDPEARAVLRAFLGVREVLWEFGLRRAEGTPADAVAHAGQRSPGPPEDEPGRRLRAAPRPVRRGPGRLERVPIS
jgi:hypothetical protein